MESEVQFLYTGQGPPVVPTRLADLELTRSRPITLLDTYYDTEALELRRSRCSLRVRQATDSVCPLVTLKGPSRRSSGAKHRYENEVELTRLPTDIDDMARLLGELGLLEEVQRLAGVSSGIELKQIGALRNERSSHRYEHGLHRLLLTWDELQFPTGPPQVRLEIEAGSKPARRLLKQAADELLDLFEGRLTKPERGKTRELCERLYPELLAA